MCDKTDGLQRTVLRFIGSTPVALVVVVVVVVVMLVLVVVLQGSLTSNGGAEKDVVIAPLGSWIPFILDTSILRAAALGQGKAKE